MEIKTFNKNIMVVLSPNFRLRIALSLKEKNVVAREIASVKYRFRCEQRVSRDQQHFPEDIRPRANLELFMNQ